MTAGSMSRRSALALTATGAFARPSFAADDAQALTTAKDAFVYAYPMLYSYRSMMEQLTSRSASSYTGAFNRFKHFDRPFTPADTFVVTPNVDTPYSTAYLDLRPEPVVFSHPEIPVGRYFVFQFFDLYTFNFAYVGLRATGRQAGKFMIAGPGWSGAKPDGVTAVINCETQLCGILGRTYMADASETPVVRALQEQYALTPLSRFLGRPEPQAQILAIERFPAWDERRALSDGFAAYLDFLLQFAPTHPSEQALRARFAEIGLRPGAPPDASRRAAYAAGARDGLAAIQAAAAQAPNAPPDAIFFGTREKLRNNYMNRAVAAMLGLYGNDKEEAVYGIWATDAAGQALTGQRSYVLRFEPGRLPPANFFWSVTMYRLPQRLLAANPINRYAIRNSSPGLQANPDGALEILIQSTSPAAAQQNNWLPAPAGPFVAVWRIYGPKPEAISGAWQPPPLRPRA